MESLRTCKICSVSAYTREDLEEFKKDIKGKYGRANYHKSCYSDHKKKTYPNYYNIDYKKKWREEHPEENKILTKRHMLENLMV